MDTFLVTLNSLCTAFAALIPSTGSLINKKGKGIKWVNKRGWVTLGFAIASITLTIYQSFRTQNEAVKKENLSKEDQNRRENFLRKQYDSSLVETKKKFDTTNVNTVLVITETLGKYGFKLDSANNRLVKVVKDSSKTKILENENPVLLLCEKGISLDKSDRQECRYNISFCSRDAGSTGFKLLIRSAYEDSVRGLSYGGITSILYNNLQIPKNTQYNSSYGYTSRLNSPMFIYKQYLYIIGTYMNIDRSKTFPIDLLYSYDHNDKAFHIVVNEERTRLINFIESSYNDPRNPR